MAFPETYWSLNIIEIGTIQSRNGRTMSSKLVVINSP